MVRSTFTYYFKSKGDDTVLVILDNNEGCMSLTNDMESAVAYISAVVEEDVYDMPIVARDSDGIFDEIFIKPGENAQFLPLRTKDEDEAIERAIERRRTQLCEK
jgi:hypothetical protein